MGVTSAGEGMGSTFYFEIPLYMMSEDIDSSGVTRRKSIRSILPSEEVFVNTQNLPQEWASLSDNNNDSQKELYSTNHNGPQLTDCISESIINEDHIENDFFMFSVLDENNRGKDVQLDIGKTNVMELSSHTAENEYIGLLYSDSQSESKKASTVLSLANPTKGAIKSKVTTTYKILYYYETCHQFIRCYLLIKRDNPLRLML